MTPLGMSLLSRSRTEVVQALLDAGANVNQRAGTGVPPIFYALPRGLPMVEMLINAGADVTVLDPSGQTVLYWAVGANYLFRHEVVEILEILLANGADINGQDIWGETPLIRAVRFKNTHAIMTLIERGADPTIKENEGRTALDLANEHEELRATEAYWRLNDLRNDQN
jgi:ankyrin repeat protein